MSLEDLEREIGAEASKKVRDLIAAANGEAAKILEEGKGQGRARMDRAKALAAERIKGLNEEFQSEAYMECRDALLKGIDESARRNMAAVKKELLRSFRGEQGKRFLEKVLRDAKGVFVDCSPKDVMVEGRKAVLPIFAKAGYSTKATGIDGVVLHSRDGAIVLDATFQSVLRQNAEIVRNRIALAVSGKAKELKDPEAVLAIAAGKPHPVRGRGAARAVRRAPRAVRRGKRKARQIRRY